MKNRIMKKRAKKAFKYISLNDGYGETYYEDNVTDLEPYCLTVDVLGNGDVDIRWL